MKTITYGCGVGMDLVHSLGNCTVSSPTPSLTVPSSEIAWFIIGSVVAAISLFIAQVGYDWYKRPVLKLDRERSPIPRTIHLDSGKPGVSGDITLDKIPYVVNRIRVLNDGRTAAENCKAILIIDGDPLDVCWWIPKERYVMTINSKDSEYVDLCAVCERDLETLIKNSRDSTGLMAIGPILGHDDVRWRIAPTEEGWHTPIAKNRDLLHGDFECIIRITAKNANPCESRIRIRERPDPNGGIVDFL